MLFGWWEGEGEEGGEVMEGFESTLFGCDVGLCGVMI